MILVILIFVFKQKLQKKIKNIETQKYDFSLENELKVRIDKIEKELEKNTEKIKEDNIQIKTSLEKINEGNEEIINEITNIKNESEKMKILINEENNENLQLKEIIKKLNSEIEELKKNITDIENSAKNKSIIIENENKELKDRIEILEIENIELKNKINTFEDLNNNLNNKILFIENEKKELSNSLDIIKNENNEIQNEQNNLKVRFDNMEETKAELNIYYNGLFSQSNIIKIEERKLIALWILPYHNIKFTLLYRASTDGFDTKIFHSKCDNKGPTVFVVKLANNNRIGGFASSSWNSNVNDIKDENAFLFSLSNKIKYDLKNKYISNALYGQENSSVLFGPNSSLDYKQDDFVITGKTAHCREEGAKYNFIMSDLCGIKHIEVEEFEVYAVQNYAK